jgi:hypothetical protein
MFILHIQGRSVFAPLTKLPSCEKGGYSDRKRAERQTQFMFRGFSDLFTVYKATVHDLFVIPRCRVRRATRSSVLSICSNRPGRQV